MNDPAATEAIKSYFRAFADIAVEHGTAFIFDSLTYRASADWGSLLGYSSDELAEMNHRRLALYREVAEEAGLPAQDVVISGCIGPKGDAYGRNDGLSAEAADAYHRVQIETFKAPDADPDELAGQYGHLKSTFPHLNVFGGCCGTDFTHVRKISEALRTLEVRAGASGL